MIDIVVAGGGPAGLAAAIHAANTGLDVVVIDPHGGEAIDKACGEGIMPGGVEALGRLGVRPEGRPFLGIHYVLAGDATCDAFGHFPVGVGLGVRRTRLSEALLACARKAGVRFRQDTVGMFAQGDNEVVLADGTRTRWLLAADGLRSPIRRALGVEMKARRRPRFGLRRHYAMSPWSAHVEVYFAPDAEAYVTPVADDLVGVAVLFSDAQAAPVNGAGVRYDSLLARFPELRPRLVGTDAASAVRGAGPFEHRVSRRVVGNVLLIGDAAGYLDPLTGEGVALGLATAEAAIESLRAGDPQSYEARYRALTRRYFAVTGSLLTVVEHPRLHRSLIRLARALPRAFDAALGTLSHLGPRETPSNAPRSPEAPMV